MLGYEEFRETLLKQVQEKLQGEVSLELTKIKKNNDYEKEAITLAKKSNEMLPMIYIQDLYDLYQGEQDVEKCADIVMEVLNFTAPVHIKDIFNDWQKIKDWIRVEIVNKEWNKERLEKVPYQSFCDLAVVCRVIVQENAESRTSSLVRWDMLKQWNITEDELWEVAYHNLKGEDYQIHPMEDLFPCIASLECESDEVKQKDSPKLYVVSNHNRIGGAAALLRTDILREVSETLRSDLYILPSSIHEVISLPVSEKVSVEELRQMVISVNRECVDPEEQLSDEVYLYRRETQKIEIAV